jgi:hypothetical protein
MDLTRPFQLTTVLISIVTLFLQFFTLYMIVYVSPKNMNDYKRYLIINTVSYGISDSIKDNF